MATLSIHATVLCRQTNSAVGWELLCRSLRFRGLSILRAIPARSCLDRMSHPRANYWCHSAQSIYAASRVVSAPATLLRWVRFDHDLRPQAIRRGDLDTVG